MKIIEDPSRMHSEAETLRLAQQRIGFVPTMGALHEGHISLIRLARQRSTTVVMSIFVNPLQFGKGEDFERYPRPIEEDLKRAENAGVDILFLPAADSFYHPAHRTFIEVGTFSSRYEGAARPGHFRGVATVVMKLFLTVQPHLAVFGQKDAQQVTLVKTLIRDMNLDIGLITAPIIRDNDGLALSSRNRYLSDEARRQARHIPEAIMMIEQRFTQGERHIHALLDSARRHLSQSNAITCEYVALVDAEDFEPAEYIQAGKSYFFLITAIVGGVRLLDNCLLHG